MVGNRLRALQAQIRFASGILSLFRQRVTSTDGVAEQLEARVARRDTYFLEMAERHIFGNPNSPYRPLLDLAGYDLPGLRQLVHARGLDAALDQLWADGVYVRVGEFKGMEPVTRGGYTFHFTQRDFANPLVRGIFRSQSSGSRSRGTATEVSASDFMDGVRHRRWLFEQYGVANRPAIVWSTALAGLRNTIQFTIMGRPPIRWFVMLRRGEPSYAFLVRLARLLTGQAIPLPEPMPADRAVDAARYVSQAGASGGVLVCAFVSSALRLVRAAEEAGFELGDVAFYAGGEPLTPLKRRQIEGSGYKVFSAFAFAEFGNAAWACPAGQEADDLHVLRDRLAVRCYPRVVDRDGGTVPAYLFTSFLPHTRHIMVNVESGDYGGLEERRCGCFLDRLGFHQHIHTVRSFEKLTAEGMTFIGPDLVTLLEEVLPREFGGDSRHYQLVEAEDERGITRLYVLASPQLGKVDDAAMRRAVLREIRRRHLSAGPGRLIEQVWHEADTVQVLRREPLATASGKVLHLHRDRGELWRGSGSEGNGGTAS